MVKLTLLIKAEFENVTNLEPASQDFEWFFEVVCNSCHETHPKYVGMNLLEERELASGHDTANFVWKCGFCKRESSAKFEKFSDTKSFFQPYQMASDKGQEFKPIALVDCRGLEFTKFDPRGTWKCVGAESGTVFEDVQFEDDEWVDYDEKAKLPVGINSIKSEWKRLS